MINIFNVTSKIIKYLKFYSAFINMSIKSFIEYKSDFIIGIISTFVMEISKFLFIWVVFKNVTNVKGWGFYEIAFIFGLLTLSKALFEFFFHNVWDLEFFVKVGYFDIILVRPVNPMFYFFSFRINIGALGETVVGLGIVIMSLVNLHLSFNAIDILMLIIFLVSGSVIFLSILLIPSTICFKYIASRELVRSVQEVWTFAQFPLNFFNKFIGAVLTLVMPYAFASFYPAHYFLDKGLKEISLLTPVVAVVLFIIALYFWNRGLKNYESTGS